MRTNFQIGTSVSAAMMGGAVAAPESVWLEAFRDSSDNGFAADFTFSDDARAVLTKTAGVAAELALTPFFSNNSSPLVIATDPDGLAMIDGHKIQVATNQIPGYTNVGTWLIEMLASESVGNNIILAGNSAAQEFAQFETYIQARLSAGWVADDIVVATMLPRGPAYEAARTAYNALLVAGAATYGYRLARLDLNPLMGYAGAYSNTTYFVDGLHPTYPVGAGVVAGDIRASIG